MLGSGLQSIHEVREREDLVLAFNELELSGALPGRVRQYMNMFFPEGVGMCTVSGWVGFEIQIFALI